MRLILMLAPLARALVPPGSTVAVIGSTGKLGRCAVRELVEQGYRARCLLRHDAAGAAPRLDAPDATAALWWRSYDARCSGVSPVMST